MPRPESLSFRITLWESRLTASQRQVMPVTGDCPTEVAGEVGKLLNASPSAVVEAVGEEQPSTRREDTGAFREEREQVRFAVEQRAAHQAVAEDEVERAMDGQLAHVGGGETDVWDAVGQLL